MLLNQDRCTTREKPSLSTSQIRLGCDSPQSSSDFVACVLKSQRTKLEHGRCSSAIALPRSKPCFRLTQWNKAYHNSLNNDNMLEAVSGTGCHPDAPKLVAEHRLKESACQVTSRINLLARSQRPMPFTVLWPCGSLRRQNSGRTIAISWE